jgi:hypothetical protein
MVINFKALLAQEILRFAQDFACGLHPFDKLRVTPAKRLNLTPFSKSV